ncbi:DEHA2B10494p [Debaryomyces hansenii CBS767]|uniref:Tethering factor for nuclear proteasome STS1 n=1 Tax=Debaryomyces hansenii (strain ATCC 36239 / CBS 767 / BCRC 21394 / JCM 1990 / NBRC 0083 / IGC 2968) TaxID=284592 RepID=STS1_DEBHA|nr:DEHA2B10494p [Debaryomyces hansenii CBS767]Q6BWL0.2 RecName: Full=Tethering factor for nuclear proteasome STS1 [Debaryomyces hansenii CBS767]CAG85413.2 DEHA2B10494p [Debaryomyces hansenii CBS767]|eukprot:XP_457409.2 DEHA2B10494p [Debaryomyces hansenii CBS767]
MMSTGFSWGTQALSESTEVNSGLGDLPTSIPRYTPNLKPVNNNHHSNGKKRRYSEDQESKVVKPTGNRKHYTTPSTYYKSKKSRTPKIMGQKLPINRLVEALDHTSLQRLLESLIHEHPEISNTIDKISPKPTLTDSIELIKQKFNSIMHHLPYKCDTESDYSYLRIKTHLNEFLNCLSDFILNFLPPIETNVFNSLKFLDEVTDLIHTLPNFSNSEFQYTKSMAYEQISNTWLIVLNHKMRPDDGTNNNNTSNTNEALSSSSSPSPVAQCNMENSAQLIKIIDELNLQQKLAKHDNMSIGKFKLVVEFVNSEIENYENFNHTVTNNGGILNDLITVDYSNFSIAARTSH